MQTVSKSKLIDRIEEFKYLFSVCTLVSDKEEYSGMVDSFEKAGFTEDQTEYLLIDNTTSNTFDAYAGINRFLRAATGQYIIICHQDILLSYDNAKNLTDLIQEVEDADPYWAVLGNAGGVNLKHLSLYVVQSQQSMLYETRFPIKTATLDENFLIIKNAANLALSGDLSGFHLYGTDICLIADVLGYNCYVIKFKLYHKSLGNADAVYDDLKLALINKYESALRPRFLRTPFARFYISGSKLLNAIWNLDLMLFIARKYQQVFKPKKGYHLAPKK